MKIWVLTTCIPDENEPCFPRVFTSQAAADQAFAEAMRDEWENNQFDEDGNTPPFPADPQEAHDSIAECNSDWGRWEVTCHDITPAEDES